MDSQFSYLRRRDSSVAMLRVRMSRRISQNQKENRERLVDARRQLDDLLEQEPCLDTPALTGPSPMKDLTNVKGKSTKNKASEEKLKQLARWKERKALEKEKQKQERERKGVFKTGLYHPIDTVYSLPPVLTTQTKTKETKANVAPSQSSRVTRSMKQQQQEQQFQKTHNSITAAKKDPAATRRPPRGISVKAVSSLDKKTENCAVVQAPSTRSTSRAGTAAPVVEKQPKNTLPDKRIIRRGALASPLPQASASKSNFTANDKPDVQPQVSQPVLNSQENQEPQEIPHEMLTTSSEKENPVKDKGVVEASSFAPEGFVFQAPAGLEAFTFAPLTPRSAGHLLAPTLASPCLTQSHVTLRLGDQRQAEPSESSRSPPQEKHDVAYFRSQMADETDNLTSLSSQWEARTDDESIPEEMRGRIRTTVGQARLLMKERFKQFGGLVDDCDLGRGEKITTCSDLQGFWDMVYIQVEDVHRKFDAVREAEARGWVEEHKPPPRQKKAVKKPSAAPAKPTGTKAGVRYGLAAVKATMRAQKKAAEAAKAAGAAVDDKPRPSDTVVFEGGFFRVESPAKTPVGCLRRSSRLSGAAHAQASPCANYTTTPRRVTRLSLALGQTSTTPVQPKRTLTPLCCATNRTPAQVTPVTQEEVMLTVTQAPFPLTPQAETAGTSMFLFTPNLKDRIRPSVCPADLMYFTPPL